MLEGGLGLLDEGLHAELLVARREGGVEELPLEAEPLGQRGLEGGLLRLRAGLGSGPRGRARIRVGWLAADVDAGLGDD